MDFLKNMSIHIMSVMTVISVLTIKYWNIEQQTGTDTESIKVVEQVARNARIFPNVLKAGIM